MQYIMLKLISVTMTTLWKTLLDYNQISTGNVTSENVLEILFKLGVWKPFDEVVCVNLIIQPQGQSISLDFDSDLLFNAENKRKNA